MTLDEQHASNLQQQLDLARWRLSETKAAIVEADQGEFAPDEEMAAIFATCER